MFIKRSLKFFIIVMAVVLALSTMAFAFAANLSFSGDGVPNAGAGSAPLTGYSVADITYEYDDTVNPVEISEVAFDLTGTATHVKVRLVDSASFTDCIPHIGLPYTCAISGVTVTDAIKLEVLADNQP
jgi:hypothetical protein